MGLGIVFGLKGNEPQTDPALIEKLKRCLPETKLWFEGEKQGYTVRARTERFLVCTKPFNPKHTVLYTVVDLVENVRGTENLVFCDGAESDEDCWRMAGRLAAGKTEVSHRNRVHLLVTKVFDTDDQVQDTLEKIRHKRPCEAVVV